MLYGTSGRRNALRVAGDSQHAPSFSPGHHEPAANQFAHASAVSPVFTVIGITVAACDFNYNLLCRRIAVVGSSVFSFS